MKSVLLLILISLISCQIGGWTKRSLAENSFYIDRSFTEAYKSYSNEENIDYDKVNNLASEARQKLNQIRPTSIGQALRISGVNPADISILMVYIKKEYFHECR